jgi:hypothetical protein
VVDPPHGNQLADVADGQVGGDRLLPLFCHYSSTFTSTRDSRLRPGNCR